MAIRKTRDEKIVVQGNIEDWLIKSEESLIKSNFKKIKVNKTINQITGTYKTLTCFGEISITLYSINSVTEQTEILIKSTANIDNLYALFKSPNKTIISLYKDNL